ncbi:MAG: hypothetical protein JWM12_1268 [Ilumatobacteraceae bacterium]|jgi:uncharacterized protein (TIGR03083 family)|nr:hypothetical protein [Ilumatobacteraceae bacterium]
MTTAAIAALRVEQQRALALFASLCDDEWQAASGCAGWRIQDVAQHMASTFHTIAEPTSIEGGTSADAEQNAEVPVEARRSWTAAQVVDEYVEWSEKGIAALAALQEPPMAGTVVALSNLGSHPLHILGNAIVFDHYCHLRHDIGATIGRAAELPRDPAALAATAEWMLAGLPQMCADALAGCAQGVNLVFEGPGGGDYALRPGDGGPWTVTSGLDPALPSAVSTMHDFVSWGTKRIDWRELGVHMPDVGGARTLDAINVI